MRFSGQALVARTGRQKADAFEIEPEAVNRLHAEGTVRATVVVVFEPLDELAVEGFERGKIEVAGQKAFPHRSKKSFDLALGRAVTHGRVGKQNAEPTANQR